MSLDRHTRDRIRELLFSPLDSDEHVQGRELLRTVDRLGTWEEDLELSRLRLRALRGLTEAAGKEEAACAALLGFQIDPRDYSHTHEYESYNRDRYPEQRGWLFHSKRAFYRDEQLARTQRERERLRRTLDPNRELVCVLFWYGSVQPERGRFGHCLEAVCSSHHGIYRVESTVRQYSDGPFGLIDKKLVSRRIFGGHLLGAA